MRIRSQFQPLLIFSYFIDVLGKISNWLWVFILSFFAGHYFTLLTSLLSESPIDNKRLLILIILFTFFSLTAIVFFDTKPKEKIVEKDKIIEKIINIETPVIIEKEVIKQNPPCEVIYIMKRQDGVLKFGKTISVENRVREHMVDYKMGFRILSAWVVFPPKIYEKIALDMTKQYVYKEGTRKELRKMDDGQISKFIADFTTLIQIDYNKRRIDVKPS